MEFYELDNQGKLWIQRVDNISTLNHVSDDEGRLVYSRSDDKVYLATSTEWVVLSTKYSVLTQNTKMIFGHYPLPPGWNITDYDDIMVSLTNNSSYVGDTSGSWTITGIVDDGGHNHGGNTHPSTKQIVLGESEIRDYVASWNHSHSILADGIHSHTFDGNWRPEYINFCEAIFNE